MLMRIQSRVLTTIFNHSIVHDRTFRGVTAPMTFDAANPSPSLFFVVIDDRNSRSDRLSLPLIV